jgi:hypothetical protein
MTDNEAKEASRLASVEMIFGAWRDDPGGGEQSAASNPYPYPPLTDGE